MKGDQRERVVRESFEAVVEEFLDLVDVDKSGSVTIHFQNGVPLTHSWEFKGRTIPRRMIAQEEIA